MKQLFATRYMLGVLVLCFLTGIVQAQTTQTFSYTGAVQTFTVPAGVTSLTVVANGAQGGTGSAAAGGKGGRVTATLTVTPGQSLSLYVGGVPFNGGGADGGAGGAGGGATDIRIGGTALSNRTLVAGGGGGGYSGLGGSSGGGLTGGGGVAYNGKGGSQSAGGAGVAGGAAGTAGTAGLGGAATAAGGGKAGGGGGGYFGGGGGGNGTFTGGGGGGGSSYTNPSLVSSVVHEQGANTGNGSMTLSWVIVMSVELLDFKGTPQYNGNLLTWTTANEVNNKGFQVERLMDNGQWAILGFVNGKGKTEAYNFVDNAPLSTSYYRLRQIDNDGKETLSKVISVQKDIGKDLKVYPNPKDKDTPSVFRPLGRKITPSIYTMQRVNAYIPASVKAV